MRPLTFVVGTGRSGSTALSRILNLHPDVLSLNEMFASLGESALPGEPVSGEEFWQVLAGPNRFFDGLTRSGVPLPEFLYNRLDGGRYSADTTGIPALCLMVLPHLVAGNARETDTDGGNTEDAEAAGADAARVDPAEVDAALDALEPAVRGLPRRPAGQQYEALFGLLSARFGGGHAVVERSGYSLQAVPKLRRVFPHARFVHLFRDGPDCAVSMSRHIGYRSIAVLREIFRRTGVSALTELTPDLVSTLPHDLSEVLGERFDPALLLERPMPVTDFGALWSELVTEGEKSLDGLPPDRRAGLSYEGLLDTPREELARLAVFAGVEPYPVWLERGAALLDGARRGAALRLPRAELAELRERCAPGMRALGLEPAADGTGVRP
ncbi:sulfotransferase [Streptomyces armeniacus]|uniref:Sulfotransferase n=1 Tax=Streptomyces armeniacus TaxID=83291 RepID=A0A345XLQ0_9ACTN|nr:sulfotransferase [Streptomyces armeniacus]